MKDLFLFQSLLRKLTDKGYNIDYEHTTFSPIKNSIYLIALTNSSLFDDSQQGTIEELQKWVSSLPKLTEK